MAFLYLLASIFAFLSIAGKIFFMPPDIPLVLSFIVIAAVYMKPDMPHLMVGALLSSAVSTIYLLSAGSSFLENVMEGDASISIWDVNPIAIFLSIASLAGLWYYHTGEVKNE